MYIPWNLGLIYIGLIYGIGTSNQSVPESWPLIRRKMLSGSERNVALFFRLGITKFHVLTNEILPVCPTRKVAKENNTILFLEGCWPQSFWWCIHIIYICIYIHYISMFFPSDFSEFFRSILVLQNSWSERTRSNHAVSSKSSLWSCWRCIFPEFQRLSLL